MKAVGSDTELRVKYDSVREQYIIYEDNKEVGHALDLDAVIDFIQIMQNSCTYSSKICDNGEQRSATKSAAQKSQ